MKRMYHGSRELGDLHSRCGRRGDRPSEADFDPVPSILLGDVHRLVSPAQALFGRHVPRAPYRHADADRYRHVFPVDTHRRRRCGGPEPLGEHQEAGEIHPADQDRSAYACVTASRTSAMSPQRMRGC